MILLFGSTDLFLAQTVNNVMSIDAATFTLVIRIAKLKKKLGALVGVHQALYKYRPKALKCVRVVTITVTVRGKSGNETAKIDVKINSWIYYVL